MSANRRNKTSPAKAGSEPRVFHVGLRFGRASGHVLQRPFRTFLDFKRGYARNAGRRSGVRTHSEPSEVANVPVRSNGGESGLRAGGLRRLGGRRDRSRVRVGHVQEAFNGTIKQVASRSPQAVRKFVQPFKQKGIDSDAGQCLRLFPGHQQHDATVSQKFHMYTPCNTLRFVLHRAYIKRLSHERSRGRDTEADPDKGVCVMTPHDFRIGDDVYEVRIVRGQRYRWELVEEDGLKIILLDRDYLRPWRMVEALVDCIDGITHRHPALRKGRAIDSRMAEVPA